MAGYRETLFDLYSDKKQQKLVDTILKPAPLIANMEMELASANLSNIYEKVISVDGLGKTNFDGAAKPIKIRTKMAQEDLAIFKGEITLGQDSEYLYGSFESYIGKRAPLIAKATNQELEKWVIYEKLRPFILQNNKGLDAKGSNNKNHEILILTMNEGENAGLYSNAGFSEAAPFVVDLIAGGELTKDDLGNPCYEAILSSYFGVQLANEQKVSGIFNIDFETQNMDELAKLLNLATTRACVDEGEALICMHPETLVLLQNRKLDNLTMLSGDTNFNTRVYFWNGIRIVPTRNMITNIDNLSL